MTSASYLVLGISLGIIVSLAAWGLVALRVLMRNRFDLVDIFVLSFGSVYGVGYAFILYATEAGMNPMGFRVVGLDRLYWTVPVLAFSCVLACLAFGGVVRAPPAPLAAGGAAPRWRGQEHHDADAWRPSLVGLGWAFLAIAVLASALYTRAYGGFAGYFEVASALRSGLFEEAGANPLSFLKPFCGFSIFSTYLFAATWLSGHRGRRFWCAAGFAASLVVSSATLLGWGGRVDLMVYWITVVFGALVYRVGVSPRLLTGVSALIAALILLMPPLTDVMNPGKSRGSYTEFFASELTFPVESSLNSIELAERRYGVDILQAPLFVLPERFWSHLNLRTVSELNSEALLGDAPREGFGYTIPADFITFGLYQFGLPGPLMMIVLWCFVLVKLDELLVGRLPRALSAFAYAHAVFVIAVLSTLYIDPKMQINRNFHFIAGMLCVLLLPRLWSLLGWPRADATRRAAHAGSWSPGPTGPG